MISKGILYLLTGLTICGSLCLWGCSNTPPESSTNALAPNQAGQGLDETRPEEFVTMICPLNGHGLTERADGEDWAGDLGVLMYQPNSNQVHIMTGDVMLEGPWACSAQSYGRTYDLTPGDGLLFDWDTDDSNLPIPEKVVATNTATVVPNGGIVVNDAVYFFMMEVQAWGPVPPNTRLVLVKSTDDGHTFDRIFESPWCTAPQMTNVSPVIGLHWTEERQVLYMVGTQAYRESDVYLAYCELNQIENPDEYWYWKYNDQQTGMPVWTQDEAAANPIMSDATFNDELRAGEICCQWSPDSKQWLVGFFNCLNDDGEYRFYRTNQLWSAWERSNVVMYEDEPLSWYESPRWRHAYGGYFLTQYMDGSNIYWVLSIWSPYACKGEFWNEGHHCLFLVKTNLDALVWEN